jgi:hypothetical protein
MQDVYAGDLMMSSWSLSGTHRGPAETLRELSVGKAMATGISREQGAEVDTEAFGATCDLKCGDDRHVIEFLNALFFHRRRAKTIAPIAKWSDDHQTVVA